MKKILFAAMAALAITSCTQNEEIEAPAKKAEIKFNTAVSKTSRAADITNDEFRNFKAYAYYHTAAWASATSINSFFSNIDYSKSNETWVGKNADNEEQTFYWPETDYVSFFAYHDPSNAATWGTEPTAKGAPTLEYTVQTTVANQKDLVVAELMDKRKNQTAGETTETVSLVFKHALTKIGFNIKGEGSGVTYTVNSITINAQGKGTYTYKASNASNAWVISGAATDYTITLADDDKTITGGAAQAANLTTNANYIAMLIPQALTDVTIKIDYIAKQGNVVLRDKSGNKAESIALSGTTDWTSGKYIVYTLGLKAGEKVNVEGTYTANSWEDGTQEINTQQ